MHRWSLLITVALLAAAGVFIGASANEVPGTTSDGTVKIIHRYLVNFKKGEHRKTVNLPHHNVTKRLVLVSAAVEANGIGNSTAPNGAYVLSLDETRLTIQVEKEETEVNRQVSVQVVDYN